MAGLKSVFSSPEGGVVGGLATAIAVLFIYNSALPSHADIRTGDANNTDIESARKGAAIKATALVGLVFLLTRDLNTFILGGGTVAGIDYLAKHHNAINPTTGTFDTSAGVDNAMPNNVFSMPDYGTANSG
jgi:hypothetical protein